MPASELARGLPDTNFSLWLSMIPFPSPVVLILRALPSKVWVNILESASWVFWPARGGSSNRLSRWSGSLPSQLRCQITGRNYDLDSFCDMHPSVVNGRGNLVDRKVLASTVQQVIEGNSINKHNGVGLLLLEVNDNLEKANENLGLLIFQLKTGRYVQDNGLGRAWAHSLPFKYYNLSWGSKENTLCPQGIQRPYEVWQEREGYCWATSAQTHLPWGTENCHQLDALNLTATAWQGIRGAGECHCLQPPLPIWNTHTLLLWTKAGWATMFPIHHTLLMKTVQGLSEHTRHTGGSLQTSPTPKYACWRCSGPTEVILTRCSCESTMPCIPLQSPSPVAWPQPCACLTVTPLPEQL